MKTKLKDIEKAKAVDILFACESGSRAWGFASPDSDYDVRFVYTHPIEWYLSTSEKRDTINLMDGDFDGVGWELRKKLRLLKKSNVPALEHLFSPITYKENSESANELRAIAKDCFSPIACMFHYGSMSLKYQEKLTQDSARLKDLFYALRTSLAGLWILEHQSMPPVVFKEMLGLVPANISEEIKTLMILKSEKDEGYKHPKSEELNNFISATIAKNKLYAKTLPSGKPDSERMDQFLYKTVYK